MEKTITLQELQIENLKAENRGLRFSADKLFEMYARINNKYRRKKILITD